jgi:hypothetical protein
MKLALVTAAYTGLRHDRPASYYLGTLNELLTQLSGLQDLEIHVFTNKENNSILVQGPNIIIHNDKIDDMVPKFWPVDNWLQIVKKIGPRMPVQQKYPETIGIYLSKFVMIKKVANETKLPILWLDSGHGISARVHYAANHSPGFSHARNRSAYKPLRINPSHTIENCLNLLDKNPIVMMTSGTFRHDMEPEHGYPEMYIFGIPMKRYMVEMDAHLRGNKHISACIMLIRNEYVDYYFSELAKNWKRLIGDNFMGHEENAMSMFYWSHSEALAMSYKDLFYMLGFKKPIKMPAPVKATARSGK